MTAETLLTVAQALAPAVAVYVAIRVDLATLRVRVDHLERDLYGRNPHDLKG